MEKEAVLNRSRRVKGGKSQKRRRPKKELVKKTRRRRRKRGQGPPGLSPQCTGRVWPLPFGAAGQAGVASKGWGGGAGDAPKIYFGLCICPRSSTVEQTQPLSEQPCALSLPPLGAVKRRTLRRRARSPATTTRPTRVLCRG